MKPVSVLLAFWVCLFGSIQSFAAQSPERSDSLYAETLRAENMVICAAIKDRTPIGATDTLPSDILTVYCYTRIVGAKDTTAVRHVWYYGDRKMAEVELPVKSSSWRTWSSKRVLPQWKGNWKVEVVAPDSTVIATKSFFLK